MFSGVDKVLDDLAEATVLAKELRDREPERLFHYSVLPLWCYNPSAIGPKTEKRRHL